METVAKTGKAQNNKPVLPHFKSDASKVQSKGMGLKKAYIGKQNQFTVSAQNAGMYTNLSYSHMCHLSVYSCLSFASQSLSKCYFCLLYYVSTSLTLVRSIQTIIVYASTLFRRNCLNLCYRQITIKAQYYIEYCLLKVEGNVSIINDTAKIAGSRYVYFLPFQKTTMMVRNPFQHNRKFNLITI